MAWMKENARMVCYFHEYRTKSLEGFFFVISCLCTVFNLAAINFKTYTLQDLVRIVLKSCKNRKFKLLRNFDCLTVKIYSDIRHKVWCVNTSCCGDTNIIHLKLEFQECSHCVCKFIFTISYWVEDTQIT